MVSPYSSNYFSNPLGNKDLLGVTMIYSRFSFSTPYHKNEMLYLSYFFSIESRIISNAMSNHFNHRMDILECSSIYDLHINLLILSLSAKNSANKGRKLL
jgi:hypothetical protein